MKTLTNKKVYIAPYSPMSINLAKDIGNIQGYIDKNATGENIYRLNDIQEYDYILIYSPNHYKAIYNEYIASGIKKSKIIIVSKDNRYHLHKNKLLFFVKERLKEYAEKTITYLSSQKSLKKNIVLFVSTDFIDMNIKYLFLYLIQKDIKTYLATSNKEHYKEFQRVSNNIVYYPSLKYFYLAIVSKIKILDRIIVSSIVKKSLSNSYIIQLWHGIAIKRLNNMNGGLKLDCVISTSQWATQNNFSKFFDADYFLESGYPRCDIFFRDLVAQDFLMIDEDTMHYINQNKDKKLVIYMPTFRENSFASNPINFDDLNKFCEQNNIIFIAKMHPFDMLKYFDTLKEVKLSNVVFYKAGCDIYPLLKSSDLLISDYSSIYFDYLLTNKPIIHFVYDKDEYVSIRGDFMFDFDEFLAGDIATDFDSLKTSIIQNLSQDNHITKRENLKRLLFDNHTIASEIIYNHINTKLDTI